MSGLRDAEISFMRSAGGHTNTDTDTHRPQAHTTRHTGGGGISKPLYGAETEPNSQVQVGVSTLLTGDGAPDLGPLAVHGAAQQRAQEHVLG
jgi:hypothetical protein